MSSRDNIVHDEKEFPKLWPKDRKSKTVACSGEIESPNAKELVSRLSPEIEKITEDEENKDSFQSVQENMNLKEEKEKYNDFCDNQSLYHHSWWFKEDMIIPFGLRPSFLSKN